MATDACGPEVIRALEKQGWQVRKRQYMLRIGERNLYADLRLSRSGSDDVQEEIIIVEVKCYADVAQDLAELYTAIGQYVVYQTALQTARNTTPLYLAIPVDASHRLTELYAADTAFQHVGAKLVIIDLMQEEIVEWIT